MSGSVPERQIKFTVLAEKTVEPAVLKVVVAANPSRRNAEGGKDYADDDRNEQSFQAFARARSRFIVITLNGVDGETVCLDLFDRSQVVSRLYMTRSKFSIWRRATDNITLHAANYITR